jgi:drug/metabolite transporter (DMT)-like permease
MQLRLTAAGRFCRPLFFCGNGIDEGILEVKHVLKPSQYAILLAIMLSASLGDSFLKRGMEQMGAADVHHLGLLWHALFNPYVGIGIVFLIGFFAAYTTALSWADLTFVMPATAFGPVVIALIGRYWLHEQLSISRWLGIGLIVCAVGFVAGGPSRTEHPELDQMDAGASR